MANTLKLAISGAAGKMGSLIMAMAQSDGYFKIAAAFERPGHPNLGQDAGGVVLQAPSLETMANCDVVIEFTTPEATMSDLALAVAQKKAMVIGTTGLTEAQIKRVHDASKSIPIVFSPNMSVGVNLLFDLVKTAASCLKDYDIEIIEAHHNQKKDAPSGTAKRLLEIARDASGKDEGEIGVHAIRAGDIVGDHTVLFCTKGERLELTHRAHSREAFARGALEACKFIDLVIKKKAGLYTMKDVLKR